MAKSRRKLRPLGERVRQLRADGNMTLARLAERSGISVSTLSKLENGQTGLHLDNVIRLAAAFEMPVSILINDAVPASGTASVARAGGPYSHVVDTLDFKVLHDHLPAQQNIFWKVRIRARTLEAFGPYHSHPGEEFFYVLEGRVKLLLKGRNPTILKQGDSVQFDSSLDHAYLAYGGSDAMILMSNTIADRNQPGFVDWTAGELPAPRQAAAPSRQSAPNRPSPASTPRRKKP
jgi:transcriptional regulator with XRE-family HTH domain